MLTITTRRLAPTDTRGARIRATAAGRTLTAPYIFDGPDQGGSGTHAIVAARLASTIVGRTVMATELTLTGDTPAHYRYTFDDRAPAPTGPVLGAVVRSHGPAGAIAYTVDVAYPGEPVSRVSFHGSTYGGPVVMVTPGNPRGTFVTDPARFGTFGPAWVRRFFGGAA